MTAYDWDNQPVNDAELEEHDAAWLEAKEQAEEDTKALRRLRAQRHARDLIRGEEIADLTIPAGTRLDDFLARPLDPVTHRIESLWPIGGRIILTAQFKAGKTTLRDEVIRALVDEDPFLGRYQTQPIPGNVALLDLELGEITMQRWLADHQIEHTDRVHVWSLQGRGRTLDLRDDKIRNTWATMLADAGTAVLVIDCLRPILDALAMSEHNEAGLFLDALDALLVDAGIGESLLLHHMGHVGERSRGDSRLRDWPMAEWRLVRDKDDENEGMDNPAGARYFSAYGRDVDHPQQELTYEPVSRHLSLSVTAPNRKEAGRRRKLSGAMDAVQKVVTAQPGIGRNALLKIIPGHNPSITEAIDLLVQDGLITRHVDGQKHLHYPRTGPENDPYIPTESTEPNRTQGSATTTEPQPYVVGARVGPGQTEETDITPGPALGPVPKHEPLDLDQLVGPPCEHCNARASHTNNCPTQPEQNGWN